ncbi:hypothetical protein EJ08DRAFT_365904 [Tothia fuscella]|uniref:Uncharacterized protein n=1 Tax=Tothia fuscella TaxID=1048955 RepID=A0A9P4NLT1_9PEZI|nr:hypothetical protein EJ08DRAFT_365904 [Tothia fuscella]
MSLSFPSLPVTSAKQATSQKSFLHKHTILSMPRMSFLPTRLLLLPLSILSLVALTTAMPIIPPPSPPAAREAFPPSPPGLPEVKFLYCDTMAPWGPLPFAEKEGVQHLKSLSGNWTLPPGPWGQPPQFRASCSWHTAIYIGNLGAETATDTWVNVGRLVEEYMIPGCKSSLLDQNEYGVKAVMKAGWFIRLRQDEC